jgi:formylglycine-generating enzyme required for sulfatase activity
MKSEMSSSSGARLILVNPGSFIMGSPSDEVGRAYFEGERPVTLRQEFYLGATPVMQRQFERVIACPRRIWTFAGRSLAASLRRNRPRDGALCSVET